MPFFHTNTYKLMSSKGNVEGFCTNMETPYFLFTFIYYYKMILYARNGKLNHKLNYISLTCMNTGYITTLTMTHRDSVQNTIRIIQI